MSAHTYIYRIFSYLYKEQVSLYYEKLKGKYSCSSMPVIVIFLFLSLYFSF